MYQYLSVLFIDYFDLSYKGSLIDGLKNIKAKTQLISIDSDWLYPTEQINDIL